MRRWIWAGLGVMAIGFAVVLAISPMARFAVSATAAGALDPGPPAIAGDIRCNDWRSCAPADRQFAPILRRRFPIGSQVNVLVSALEAEGFKRRVPERAVCTPRGVIGAVGELTIPCPAWDANWDPHNELRYGWGHIPCGSAVVVRWSADRMGKVTHIEGYFDYACL